ncbi:MAG: CRISPR-associated endoribonuclease Cas6 [Thermoplasmata archaeon]|jgi:CRISPR-associated endoribonuclease Cas6
MGNSITIYIKKYKGDGIPFEYNYYLAINFYGKLEIYNNKIRKIHTPESYSIHTFSNIITKNFKFDDKNLFIEDGIIIFRSLDARLIEYLKLGFAISSDIKLFQTLFKVEKIKQNDDIFLNKFPVKFKTLSPVVVRDFENPKYYVDSEDRLIESLKFQIKYFSNKYFNYQPKKLEINLIDIKRKTVRISSSENKESITTGFNLKGEIDTDINTFKLIYYRGLGSKTGLGLGCIEVIQ